MQKALVRGVRDLVAVVSKGRSGSEGMAGCLGGRLRTHTGNGASELGQLNVLQTSKDAKTAKTRVAVFVLSYSYPYATLCLFFSPMGQYISMLLNMESTGFICIAESNFNCCTQANRECEMML